MGKNQKGVKLVGRFSKIDKSMSRYESRPTFSKLVGRISKFDKKASKCEFRPTLGEEVKMPKKKDRSINVTKKRTKRKQTQRKRRKI